MNAVKRAGPADGPIESGADWLGRAATAGAMSIDLVSAFAGDRETTPAEKSLILEHKRVRGDGFYSDLLYAISHHSFSSEVARILWGKILSHKHLISDRLGRNTRIAVAALDYLSNVTTELKNSTLISEGHVSKMTNLAMRDGMTGLFNQSSSNELLALSLRNHRRYGGGMSVLLLDIDDFKSVNDRCGHQEGDRVLIELAATLIEQTRDSDICCRIGGDEFLVVLRNADADETSEVAERIREKAARITAGGSEIAISVGIVLCDGAITSPRALMLTADRALYEAKRLGKNQVVLGVSGRPAPGSCDEPEDGDPASLALRARRESPQILGAAAIASNGPL